MALIDIGANLAHDSFNADRTAVLHRAHEAGVEAIVITGSSAESSRKALELAQHYSPSPCGRGLGGGVAPLLTIPLPQSLPAGGREVPCLYSTAGLHPHHASEWNADHAAQFRDLARHEQLVALGECGLDYFRDLSPRAEQRRAFIAQLELAAELHKPVFLHQRDAHADFLPILREFRPQLADAVVHCFTDTEGALTDYLALDCHVGITGWVCDERRGAPLHSAAKRIPDNRLLIETDAPYLLPRTASPKPAHRRNEPCYLPYVVQALAKARRQSEQHVARITAENARRFFGLAQTIPSP